MKTGIYLYVNKNKKDLILVTDAQQGLIKSKNDVRFTFITKDTRPIVTTEDILAPEVTFLHNIDINSLATYKYSKKSLNMLNIAHWELRIVFLYMSFYRDIKILESARGREKQEEYFESGASKAHFGESPHNQLVVPLAVDAIEFPVSWKSIEELSFFGGMIIIVSEMLVKAGVLRNGIIWGGKWHRKRMDEKHKFTDRPHFQVEHWKQLKAMSRSENEEQYNTALPKLLRILVKQGFLTEKLLHKNIQK